MPLCKLIIETLVMTNVSIDYQDSPARGECRSCYSDVIWTITERGERMPVNIDPEPNGNLILSNRAGRTNAPSAIYVGKPDPEALFDEYEGQRYISHFATCPQKKQWRR